MKRRNRYILSLLLAVSATTPHALRAQTAVTDSLSGEHELQTVEVKATNGTRSRLRIENTDVIGQGQLIRAACCNLGESFTTNPSVDVSYTDAATGAMQIKLLGLAGTYVQMLTENIPNLRGASLPYSLGYVPGPWMRSIQVSKGASSVKNGYESTTGQINIEFLKPQGTDGIRANAYLDSDMRHEVNVDGSIHLTDRLSTSMLMHFENSQMDMDDNEDGFMDDPLVRQYNGMWRMAYVSPVWISQFSVRMLRDERDGGQSLKHRNASSAGRPYTTSVRTNRYEAQWKNGITLNADNNTSVALMLHGSYHDAANTFGPTHYDVTQRNGYAQLMFETDLSEHHNLSLGASVNADNYDETLSIDDDAPFVSWMTGTIATSFPKTFFKNKETTAGVYAQYTYKLDDKLTVMPGIRWDHSNCYGAFVTPRLHVKYSPTEWFTLRASTGKGYRSPHALAENTPLLASGRPFFITHDLKQEEAWNTGVSVGLNIPVGGRMLEINGEYYYTNFLSQMVINIDGSLRAYDNNYVKGMEHSLSFENLDGKSYSHTLQLDATYPFFDGFSATAAFRLNDVKCTYDGELRQKPLTSRYKGLLTLSYKTPMELWQFDVTGQLNGGGTLYSRTTTWDNDTFPAFFQLQAQVTREFRQFSIYIGGENLTNYTIANPIINAHQPWSTAFDATQIWGPVTGAMAYIGIRFKLEKL